jgi:protein gp37
MAHNTNIEWTEATWNPIRGCTRVSEGCRNCYAERQAIRHAGPGGSYEGLVKITNGHPQWTGKVKLIDRHLADPLKWRDPRRIFVNSMSDLFHEELPFEIIDKIFAVMTMCHQHTFQVLTKRPERMLQYMKEIQDADKDVHRWVSEACEISGSPCASHLVEDADWPPKNIWFGVSVENQKTAEERIPLLLQTPAAVRWISAEPLLEHVNLKQLQHRGMVEIDALDGTHGVIRPHRGTSEKLDWVVVGGESGPGSRPMHPEWASSLRDQCKAAGVAFFFKQWGEYLPAMTDGNPNHIPENLNCSDRPVRVGKKAAGRLLDGKEYNEYPQIAEAARG